MSYYRPAGFRASGIDYVPGDWLVESKALKLYLASFRNHGGFHEECTIAIGKRLVKEVKPRSCALAVLVSARRHSYGRILADRPPAERLVDRIKGVAPYRGRG